MQPEDMVSVCSSNEVDDTVHSEPTEQQPNANQEAQAKKRRKVRANARMEVKVEQPEETPQKATKPKKTAKKGTKPKTTKKKEGRVVRTEQAEQEDAYYDADEEEWYDDDWYGDWYGDWHGMETKTTQPEADTYPWGMWNLITDELKLEEDPNVIHDVCVALQAQHINLPWQLKQAPRSMLDKLFPVESQSRQLFVVLHTQEYLMRKSEAESSGHSSYAKAMNRMVREQTKARHADTHQETSSDDDAGTVTKYEHYKAMQTYHLENIPQAHTIKVEKMEPYAKRAKSG